MKQRSTATEQMDEAELDPATYARVLADLAKLNTLTLSARSTLGFLARATKGRSRFSLLDVGFGHGDMLRRIARWARRRGIEAELTGIDLNPKSEAIARAATPPELGITWMTGDYRALGGFDLIVSSIVAHHMTAGELDAFIRHMEANAGVGWLINDLHRLAVSRSGFLLLASLLRVHPIVRHDGRVSIERSFRHQDWEVILARAGVAPGTARIVRRFPFRLCVERLR